MNADVIGGTKRMTNTHSQVRATKASALTTMKRSTRRQSGRRGLLPNFFMRGRPDSLRHHARPAFVVPWATTGLPRERIRQAQAASREKMNATLFSE
jgi:hypothetical protein